MSARQVLSARVFLADDQPLVREGLRTALTGRGMQVVGEASSQEEALTILSAISCDVVIVDPAMSPSPDEPDAMVKALRKLASRVPILVLTAKLDEDSVLCQLRAGANAYLSKSTSVDEVVLAVREVLIGGAYIDPRVALAVLSHLRRAAAKPEAGLFLSERDRSVLRLLVAGESNQTIADALHVSVSTVKGTLRDLFTTLEAPGRSRLVARILASPDLVRCLQTGS